MPPATGTGHRSASTLRSAALVVLAGMLWSMGGLLVKLVEEADLDPDRALPLPVRDPGGRRRSWCSAAADLVRSTRALGWNGLLRRPSCLATAFVGFVTALTLTTVANAVLRPRHDAVRAALLGWLILGEPVRRSTWLAMALAGCGLAVIAAPGLGPGGLAGTLLALVLLSRRSRCSASRCAAARRSTARLAADWRRSSRRPPARSSWLLRTGPAGLAISRHDLLACAVMGIVQIGCGLVAFTAGSRHLPAADLALLAQTEVVLAPVWAWLVVGEVPAFWTLVGGTMVLAAVTLQALTGARRSFAR